MTLAPTALQSLDRLGSEFEIDLKVKRDDLLPMTGSGNKVRKMKRILEELEALGCDAVVTSGGLQSNHARVTALVAAERGWRCKLVLHGDPKRTRLEGNLLLMTLAGAEIEVVSAGQVRSAIEKSVFWLQGKGYLPHVIPGGGHCLAGALAYWDATHELADQCRTSGWSPDYVVIASGTGATQAGLVVGLEQMGWLTRVLGISVARSKLWGTIAVEQSRDELRANLGLSGEPTPVEFYDDWVGAGYEKASSGANEAIRLAAAREGLVLDPTYTGKAFAALLELRETQVIKRGARVLFWHTGGLLNLMASRCFDNSAEG